MRKVYFLLILLLFVGCGDNNNKSLTQILDNNISEEDINVSIDNNNSNNDINISTETEIEIIDNNDTNNTSNHSTSDENSSSEEIYDINSDTSTTEVDTNTTEVDTNTTEVDTNTTTKIDKFGKAQLGVIANAIVTIYKINGSKKELIATEKTSSGDTIDTIGNFNLHINELEDDKFYIYEVSGGEDYDIEDDGIINSSPTKNKGVFHLIGKGYDLKSIEKVNITIISEIMYQEVLSDINNTSLIKNKINNLTKKIIEKDINGDSIIDFKDILFYDPVNNKSKLFTTYQVKIIDMIGNIINGKNIYFEEPIINDSTTGSSGSSSSSTESYPVSEAGIQEALDDRNYDYVISQLTTNSGAYSSVLNSDEINMNIAGAYVGKSGYTVFDITSAIGDSSSSLNNFVSGTTKNNNAVDTINQLKKADDYYSSVVSGVDCSDTDSLTEEQKSSCFNLGLVRLTSLSNSVKLLFGGDKEVIKKWADGVETNSTDDLNGNSVIDGSDASACAIVYASNPNDNCRDGSMATYRKKVTFTKDGINYNTTLIDVDVGSSKLGYKTFKRLVTNTSSNNSAILTDGVCDINFNKTTNSIDGVTYFPCPVINNRALMNIADSLASASGVQSLFPTGSETRVTIDSYIKNITGSKNGVIDQNNLSTYLQGH